MPKFIIEVATEITTRHTVEADDEHQAYSYAEEEAGDMVGWNVWDVNVASSRVVGYPDD